MLEGLEQILTRLGGYSPWKVLLQIAVIWWVVYVVFSFLRGTRGARALQGVFLVLIAALMVVEIVGTDPDFAPLQFLLSGLLGFTALALVIVFQPEIRRALVRLGEARLFRHGSEAMEPVIDQIVEAAEYLSKHKIGAIIAIERTVGLEGIVQAGTRLNARVAADLLKTIFWPGTALHDMGVVIRGENILAAGVQFPLAEGEDISQELGSRHRAAVGLSQEADCLVLVISEETGAISIAERGQLLRKLSTEGLRLILRRGLSVTASPQIRKPEGRDTDKTRRDDGDDQQGPSIGKTAA